MITSHVDMSHTKLDVLNISENIELIVAKYRVYVQVLRIQHDHFR